jgi:acyl-CoA thioesterase YciA
MSADRYLALKSAMLPKNTNQYGTIFGGVLLSLIDQAGAVGADHAIRSQGWPASPLVTVAMNGVEFHQPVFVGDVVSFYTHIVRIGTTSLTVHVTVEADRGAGTVLLTEADVTFVAVDLEAGRKPRPLRGE